MFSMCSNAYHSIIIILLYNGFNINNYYIIRMYFITMFMIPMQQVSPFQVQCSCAIKFHVAQLMNTLMKMASNSSSNLCSFIVSNAIGMVLESV